MSETLSRTFPVSPCLCACFTSADKLVSIFRQDHLIIFGPYLVSILPNWSLFWQNSSSNVKFPTCNASLAVEWSTNQNWRFLPRVTIFIVSFIEFPLALMGMRTIDLLLSPPSTPVDNFSLRVWEWGSTKSPPKKNLSLFSAWNLHKGPGLLLDFSCLFIYN